MIDFFSTLTLNPKPRSGRGFLRAPTHLDLPNTQHDALQPKAFGYINDMKWVAVEELRV